jgi:hypothetical protein
LANAIGQFQAIESDNQNQRYIASFELADELRFVDKMGVEGGFDLDKQAPIDPIESERIQKTT